jgi:hypothetical protein
VLVKLAAVLYLNVKFQYLQAMNKQREDKPVKPDLQHLRLKKKREQKNSLSK